MGFSIQDNLKKINSSLSFIDILSLFVTALSLLLLYGYLSYADTRGKNEVIYQEGVGNMNMAVSGDNSDKGADSRAFGSAKGKTYTFSWCQGASRISAKNKIYFESEAEAKGAGRTLSKLCKK